MKLKNNWDLGLIITESKLPLEKERVLRESNKFIRKWKEREDYLSDPVTLAEALSEYEEWERRCGLSGKLWYFWSLRSGLDQNDPSVKANLNQTINLANSIQNEVQFFEHRIAHMSPAMQKKMLAYPGLKKYGHFLTRLWEQAKYLLSESEEKIMTLKANSSAAAWERMTSGLISKEEREVNGKVKNFSEIYNLLNNTDKKTRDGAALAMNDILNRWVEVGEAEMNAILGDKKVNDELRGFLRPDGGRFIADDVEPEMVDALIEAARRNFDVAGRFYKLKAKLFGVSRLEYYERSVPYGKVDKKYEFKDAVKLTGEVFARLDPEFEKIFERLIGSGQVDVFPKKGKRSGAFCSHDLVTLPTYVLLNYDDKLESVLTLAHEFGHAINNEMMKGQSPFYFHTSLATAEVASTFFESFVVSELLSEADDELKLALMVKQLDDDTGVIFRQAAMYLFEKDLHKAFREKGYLSKEEIGSLWVSHAIKSMGPAVNATSGSENWWLYVPHIREFFYVYSYASGQLISKVLQAKVRKDKGNIKLVKQFLAAGTSKSPKDLFLDMGVNVSDPKIWEEGILEIDRTLKETEKLARLLGKFRN